MHRAIPFLRLSRNQSARLFAVLPGKGAGGGCGYEGSCPGNEITGSWYGSSMKTDRQTYRKSFVRVLGAGTGWRGLRPGPVGEPLPQLRDVVRREPVPGEHRVAEPVGPLAGVGEFLIGQAGLQVLGHGDQLTGGVAPQGRGDVDGIAFLGPGYERPD